MRKQWRKTPTTSLDFIVWGQGPSSGLQRSPLQEEGSIPQSLPLPASAKNLSPAEVSQAERRQKCRFAPNEDDPMYQESGFHAEKALGFDRGDPLGRWISRRCSWSRSRQALPISCGDNWCENLEPAWPDRFFSSSVWATRPSICGRKLLPARVHSPHILGTDRCRRQCSQRTPEG